MDPDVQATLQALAAQQTALLTAYTEGLRLQQLLLEHTRTASAPVAPPVVVESDEPEDEGVNVSPPEEESPPPARRVSAPVQAAGPDLALLKRLAGLPAAQQLVLSFGPHKGATLAQVAQEDPAYLHILTRSAPRTEVRAAAREVIRLLPGRNGHGA